MQHEHGEGRGWRVMSQRFDPVGPPAEGEDRLLADRLHPWTRQAEALIARRVGDARAHAEAGRLPAAAERLAELGGALAGHIRDARAAFYHQAFRDRDPAVHRDDLHPDAEGERVAR